MLSSFLILLLFPILYSSSPGRFGRPPKIHRFPALRVPDQLPLHTTSCAAEAAPRKRRCSDSCHTTVDPRQSMQSGRTRFCRKAKTHSLLENKIRLCDDKIVTYPEINGKACLSLPGAGLLSVRSTAAVFSFFDLFSVISPSPCGGSQGLAEKEMPPFCFSPVFACSPPPVVVK